MARSKRSAEKEAFWRSMLEQQREGGLNIRAFCRQKGISEPSFHAWRTKLRKRDATRDPDAACGRAVAGRAAGRLVPVEIVDSKAESSEAVCRGGEGNLPLEICTPGGFTLRFDHDATPDTISRLLDVINGCPIRTRQTWEGGSSC